MFDGPVNIAPINAAPSVPAAKTPVVITEDSDTEDKDSDDSDSDKDEANAAKDEPAAVDGETQSRKLPTYFFSFGPSQHSLGLLLETSLGKTLTAVGPARAGLVPLRFSKPKHQSTTNPGSAPARARFDRTLCICDNPGQPGIPHNLYYL